MPLLPVPRPPRPRRVPPELGDLRGEASPPGGGACFSGNSGDTELGLKNVGFPFGPPPNPGSLPSKQLAEGPEKEKPHEQG